MKITEDAGKLLIFFYQEYIKNDESIEAQKVIDVTKWDSGKINRAIKYLEDLEAIEITRYMGNIGGVYNFLINGLTPTGIHMVESGIEFKTNFGFEVGLPGVFKIKWGVTEK